MKCLQVTKNEAAYINDLKPRLEPKLSLKFLDN